MDGGWNAGSGWLVCSWWSVRWSVMERESEVTTGISHPLFQQVVPWHVDRLRQRRCSLDQPNTVRARVETKQQVGQDLRLRGV